jgi:TonB-linked SusC/RagA family outer membrane protein
MKKNEKPPTQKLHHYRDRRNLRACFSILIFMIIACISTDLLYAADSKSENVLIQQSSISGTILDEMGTPLPGASIVEKGTTNGTQTDFDGNYTLDISSSNSIIIISYIGYESKEISVVSGQTTYNVSLNQDTETLDEVVVVGYGTQKKREVTGAISSISADAINKQTITGFDQAMAGRVAGVQVSQNSGAPGGSTSIRVRGIGTPGNSEPLYVIDGVPVFNSNSGGGGGSPPSALNTINPNDIESIEILKDAASGAIYGSRAANGVVIITTKKGKAGAPKLNLDYSIGIQSKEKNLDILDGPTYQEFITEFSGAAPTYTNPANTNYIDEIFQSATVQNMNLNVSGGNEVSKYSLSLGYLDQGGIIRGTDFERLSLRVNTSHDVSKRFRIGNNFSVSRSINNQTPENSVFNAAIGRAAINPPVIPARNADGSIGQPGDVGTSFIRSGGPLYVTDERLYEAEQFRFLGNVFAEYDIFEDLTYRINLGGDFLASGSNLFSPSLVGSGSPDILSTGQRFDSKEWIWLAEHTLNYKKQFNDIHNLNVLVGFTQQQSTFSSQSTSGTNFVSNDLIALSTAAERIGTGNLVDWSLMSYLGRVNYNLKDKYFISASVRRDGSSKFGPGNKWGVFPAFSAGWQIADEEFFNVDFIDELKLRGSWGQLGNQEIGNFNYLALLFPNAGYGFGGNVGSGNFSAQPANANITWETAEQTDIGFDLSLLNKKITLSVDYFDKQQIDILLPGSLPLAYGFIVNGAPQFPTVNAGIVRNKGLEFDLGIKGFEEDFSWSVNANLATLNNNVESDNGSPIIRDGESISIRFQEGLPIGTFYGYKVDGVFQNQAEIDGLNPDATNGVYYQASNTSPGDFKFKDLNGDGIVDSEDQTAIGSGIPDFTYGLNANINYKDFDFSMSWQGVQGNEIFANILQQAGDFTKPDNKFTKLYENAWRGEGTSNTVPAIGNGNGNYRNSDYYIQDGSFLRLRSLQIGYSLPNTLLETLQISNFRIYVGGQNLLTFDNYEYGLDPEIGANSGDTLENGVDRGRYPIPRTISMGVNIGF